MDRRHSIRLMLATAIAPAFVAKGLMPVKPLVEPGVLCTYAPIDRETVFDVEFMYRLKNDPEICKIQPLILHPTMYEQLIEAQDDLNKIAGMFAIPEPYLGMDWIVSTKKITVQEALAQYPDNERLKLMIAANQVGNHNGYIKPVWENEDEV